MVYSCIVVYISKPKSHNTYATC